MKLNLGSGDSPRQDCLNVDLLTMPGVDVQTDLNQALPFRDQSVTEIFMFNTLEHLQNLEFALQEAHRVLAERGLLHIIVPHAYSPNAFRDPTHRSFFTLGTFDFFTSGGQGNFYFHFSFSRVLRRSITFSQKGLRNRLLEKLTARRPWLYENTVLRAFPCLDIEVTLQK